MARARLLKPDFWKNEELAVLPFEARLLFQGLWNLSDREGRLEDRPLRIKADIFPYDSVNVDELLSMLAGAFDVNGEPLLIRYTAQGKAYIQITKFLKHQSPHQNEPKSTIPAPPKTVAKPEQHQTSTVVAQESHSASTIQAPERKCPLDGPLPLNTPPPPYNPPSESETVAVAESVAESETVAVPETESTNPVHSGERLEPASSSVAKYRNGTPPTGSASVKTSPKASQGKTEPEWQSIPVHVLRSMLADKHQAYTHPHAKAELKRRGEPIDG